MLQISEYLELHALVDSLLTIKFEVDCADPEIRMIAGSPFISSLLRRAYAAEIEVARANFNELAARMREDRQNITKNDDFVVCAILSHLSYALEPWRIWDRDRKLGFIDTLASPFLLSNDVREYLVAETDRRAIES